MHHHDKKDAPSGTAERLIDLLKDAYALDNKQVIHGRLGQVGARPSKEIGVHAIRGGDIVGEHTVYFCGEGERLELTHRATDRTIFAQRSHLCRTLGDYRKERALQHGRCIGYSRLISPRKPMIAYLKGTVLEATPLEMVLDVQGVGYVLNIPVTTAEKIPGIGSLANSLSTPSTEKIVPLSMVLYTEKIEIFSAYSLKKFLESGRVLP